MQARTISTSYVDNFEAFVIGKLELQLKHDTENIFALVGNQNNTNSTNDDLMITILSVVNILGKILLSKKQRLCLRD